MDNLFNSVNETSSNVIHFPLNKIGQIPTEPISLNLRRAIPFERSFNGPVSGAMWKKIQKMKSNYPDTFDWGIYDKLHAKFGNEQPKGGVVFGQTFKLVNWHNTCSKCHYAFEIDTYGRGCIHNCSYCYAKDSLTKRGYWNRPHPFPIDLSELRKIFFTVFETDKLSKWREILETKIPLRIGSMSDSFMWMDRKYGVTLELLKILKFYNYPYVIFTRSDLLAQDEYLKALDPELAAVQFSISGLDEELTRKIEPGAPSVKRRFVALKKLGEAGFWTTVRVNPLFPTYPDGYFTDRKYFESRFSSEKNIPKFPLFDIDRVDDFVDTMKEAKVPTLLVGMVRLTSFSLNQLSLSSGTDMKAFFKPGAFLNERGGNTDKNFSDSEIAYYYKKIQNAASKQNVRFTTCYIGNSVKDYFQYQSLWSNKSDCCDVKLPSFQTSSQDIDWETRAKHAPNQLFVERTKAEEKYVAENKESLKTEVIPNNLLRTRIKISNGLTKNDHQQSSGN